MTHVAVSAGPYYAGAFEFPFSYLAGSLFIVQKIGARRVGSLYFSGYVGRNGL
jgi:hypothetical protein